MIHYRLEGRLQVAIREGNRVVKKFPWQKNLLLDQGLDKIATMPFNEVFANCCAGTGSNPTGRDPHATATISGQNLTASAAVFTTSDLDTDVVFSTGQRFKIQSLTGAAPTAQVTTFQSGTIATATPFTLQYTNQSILAGEVVRTSQCLQSPGANSSTVLAAGISLQRTFLFPFEADPITYTEIGFSDQPLAGANLFSRIALATPISLSGPSAEIPSGQQLQVTYQLTINFDYGQGPGVFFPGRTAVTIPVTNLPVQYSIWQYAASTSQPNNVLAITVQGACPALIGESVTIAGSSVTAYNGSWEVLDSIQLTDNTHGISTVLSLNLGYTTTATGGTLTIPLTGAFFRGNQGIYLVNSGGLSTAPSPTADPFNAYGEPSVAGDVWASPLIAQGNNGAPAALDPGGVYSALSQLQPYTAGSFHLDRIGNVQIGSPPIVISFGYGYPDQTNQIQTWVWDQPHALVLNSSLSFTFRMSWSR
jgi:hypothetical protein